MSGLSRSGLSRFGRDRIGSLRLLSYAWCKGMMMKRRAFVITGLAGGWATRAVATSAGLRPLNVMIQGPHRINHLPLVLAQRLGYFVAEGLDVSLQPVPPSVRTLADLAGLPAQVFAGSFERNLYLSAQGKQHQSFALMSRSPQVVLGTHARTPNNGASLRGLVGGRLGVYASGSMSHRMAQLMLLRAGMRVTDVQFVEVPDAEQAISTFLHGDLEAICYTDPVISRLERTGSLRTVVDTRSLKACLQLFGGPIACTCLSAPVEFIDKEPEVVQGLAYGIVRALKWLQTAGPSDLVRHLSEAHMGWDRSVFLSGFNRSRETLAVDGLFHQQSAHNVMRALDRLRLPLDLGAINPDQTWTNRFALRAKARFRA